MKLPEVARLCLAAVARLITGAHGHWYGARKASVTGAVGLLGRVAPLCFAAPVFFHSVRRYFGF